MENSTRKVREENAPFEFENFYYIMWVVTVSSEICTYMCIQMCSSHYVPQN